MGKITGSPSLSSLGSPSQAVRKARWGKWDNVRMQVIPRETEELRSEVRRPDRPVQVPPKPKDRLLRERCLPHPELRHVVAVQVNGSGKTIKVGGAAPRHDAIAKMALRCLPWWERDRLDRAKRRDAERKRKQRAAKASVKRDRKRRQAERRETAAYLQAKYSRDRALQGAWTGYSNAPHSIALAEAMPWIVQGQSKLQQTVDGGWRAEILVGRGASVGVPEQATLVVRAHTEAQCRLLVQQRVKSLRNS
jgi:hypothetical protein